MNTTQNVTGYPEDDEWWYAIAACQTAVGILLFLLTETGNILTLVAVVKYRSLQKQQYFFIPSMAATDALLGLAVGLLLIQVTSGRCVRLLFCVQWSPSNKDTYSAKQILSLLERCSLMREIHIIHIHSTCCQEFVSFLEGCSLYKSVL